MKLLRNEFIVELMQNNINWSVLRHQTANGTKRIQHECGNDSSTPNVNNKNTFKFAALPIDLIAQSNKSLDGLKHALIIDFVSY